MKLHYLQPRISSKKVKIGIKGLIIPPFSPLTASTFLLIGLSEVELGEHQKFVFKWAWGTTIVMTIVALLTGSLHI